MIKALIEGLLTTLKHFFRRSITMKYPEEKWTPPERFRGRHIFLTNDEGKPLCIACGLCVRTCPCECIELASEKNPDGPGKVVTGYSINYLRCCFCGLCVEVCPKNAIRHGPEYELAAYDKESLIMDMDTLLDKGVNAR